MARARRSIGVGSPDPVRVAEEVRATGESRLLSRGEQQLALVVPITPTLGRRRRSLTGCTWFYTGNGWGIAVVRHYFDSE